MDLFTLSNFKRQYRKFQTLYSIPFFCLTYAFYAVVSLKILNRMAVQTQIRLLLQEQSDLGLHCLHMTFCQTVLCMKF